MFATKKKRNRISSFSSSSSSSSSFAAAASGNSGATTPSKQKTLQGTCSAHKCCSTVGRQMHTVLYCFTGRRRERERETETRDKERERQSDKQTDVNTHVFMLCTHARAHSFLSFQALLQGGKLRAQIWLREFLLLFVYVCVCVFFLVLKTVTQHAFLLCCGRWKLRLGRCKR